MLVLKVEDVARFAGEWAGLSRRRKIVYVVALAATAFLVSLELR